MPAGITPVHLLLVLVIALVVIGPGKLPSVGKALGESIREFRKATTDEGAPPAPPAPPGGASGGVDQSGQAGKSGLVPGAGGQPGNDAMS